MPKTKDSEVQGYLRSLLRYPVVRDPKKVVKLLEQWRNHGDKRAYEQLLYGNTRLVLSVANKHKNRGMDLLDLIQEGFIGLMRALKDFDPKKSKISTYGPVWIRQAITRTLNDKLNAVRVPVGMQGKMFCVSQAVTRFYKNHRRHPTHQEIYDEIHALDDTEAGTGVTRRMKLKDVVFCQILLSRREASLDKLINPNDEDSLSFGDVVADTRVNVGASVEVKGLKEAVSERVKQALQEEKDPERTFSILRLRFESDWTLQSIGDSLGLSRERIRQITNGVVVKIAKDLKINQKGIQAILAEIPFAAYDN